MSGKEGVWIVSNTDWPGCWLYVDEITGYQLLDDRDLERWILIEQG